MIQPRGLCYLAAPYSDPNPSVIEQRMEQVSRAQAHLIKQGFMVVTPLSAHYLLKYQDLPGDWVYWRDYGTALLRACDNFILLPLPGWENSIGVNAEISIARDLDMPCFQCDPGSFTLERFPS